MTRYNPRTTYVEGKTIAEIAEESGLNRRTVRDRYDSAIRRGEQPTVVSLQKPREYTWHLIGLNVEQWLTFLNLRGTDVPKTWNPNHLRSWVLLRRKRGMDDKAIARELLERFQIELPAKEE